MSYCKTQLIEVIATLRYVRIKLFSQITGYTEKAVRRKIDSGAWAQGIHYQKAPDGHILIDLEAVEKWITNEH